MDTSPNTQRSSILANHLISAASKTVPHFHRLLGERYTEFEDKLDETNPDIARQLWHTLQNCFDQYYGEAIVRYLVTNYRLHCTLTTI